MSETPKTLVTNDLRPYLTVRVEPDEMVQYVHNLMTAPNGGVVPDASAAQAVRQWGDTPLARAAQLRWSALNRAIGDARVSTWTSPKRQDKVHVAAALIGAAGVARLKMAEDEVVFDIPTLLDVTLQLCEPVGHALGRTQVRLTVATRRRCRRLVSYAHDDAGSARLGGYRHRAAGHGRDAARPALR